MQRIIQLCFIILICVNTSAQQTMITRLKDASSGYDIQDSVMIRTRDGSTISAIVVRKKGDTAPKPAILQF